MTFKPPAIPGLTTGDQATMAFAQAVRTAFEAMAKAGMITQDDLDAIEKAANKGLSSTRTAQPGDLVLELGSGETASVPASEVASKVLATQAFKDAIAGVAGAATNTQAAGSGMAADVEIRLLAAVDEINRLITATNSAADAAQLAADDTRKLAQSTAARYRGPIRSFGVASAWNNTTAAQCVYWMWLNGGTGSPPTFPANLTDYLVIGDTVTMRDAATGSSSYMQCKQWLGISNGWVATPATVSFHDVTNLDVFLTNVTAVINASLQLVGSTVIAGTGRTLAQNDNTLNGTGTGTVAGAFALVAADLADIRARLHSAGIAGF